MAKNQFLNWKKFNTARNAISLDCISSKLFPVQKLIFGHFYKLMKIEFGRKKICEIGLVFDFTNFFCLDS